MDQVVEGYEAGKPLATLGREFGVDANTVRTKLLARGVTMRSAAGVRSLKRDLLSASGESEL